ncbi:MAG: GIY-YIG nuclease family protein [Caulobacterales bacterium]|nr:GIY-YIG nuclease family protein [Caulobacterales bacterium]
MLTFNALLRAADVPVEGVTLARHQDTRLRDGLTTFRLWRDRPDEFAVYEATQGRPVFRSAGHVASFVVDHEGETVFVGLSRVLDCAPNAEAVVIDCLGEHHGPGSVLTYDLERDRRFAPYQGRLVIDWGPGARSWCQRAANQDKPIVELRREVRDAEWPGYMGVSLREDEIRGVPPNWAAKLGAANGVYLLVCPETGEQYVGAAFGAGGFLARWRAYAADGHGGNVLLRERRRRTQAPLAISILEVFGSAITEDEAHAAESRWKRALGTRAHGLNAN